MTECACGCGGAVRPGSAWVHGSHHARATAKYPPDWPKHKREDARSRELERAAKEVMGNRCSRCGIAYPLVWDHVNDDGSSYRGAADGSRRRAVRRLHAAELRSIVATGCSGVLQLLCPNCNHLKQFDRAEYDRPPTYGPAARLASEAREE